MDYVEKVKNVFYYLLNISKIKHNKLWDCEINSIIKAIDDGYKIPDVIKALVDEKEIKQDNKMTLEWESTRKNVLFPLPYNEEQLNIVNKISKSSGLVIETLPKIDKRYTIVNLISNFLAHGKKVLITSDQASNLKEIVGKIPDEIRHLCVSYLNNDKENINTLEKSIKTIVKNLSEDEVELNKEIIMLNTKINKLENKEKLIYCKLKEIELLESRKLTYEGHKYSLMDIAKWINKNEHEYGWIKDNIRFDKNMPVTEKEFDQFINLLINNDKTYIDKINKLILICDKLPNFNEMDSRISRFIKLNKDIDNCLDYIEGWDINQEDEYDFEKIKEIVINSKIKIKDISKDKPFNEIFKLYYESNIFKSILDQLAINLKKYLNDIVEYETYLKLHSISIPNTSNLEEFYNQYIKLYENIRQKGKITKVFKVFNGKYEYILNECLVDNKQIENIHEADILKSYLEEKILLECASKTWTNVNKHYVDIKEISPIENVIQLEKIINKLDLIISWNNDFRDSILKALGSINISRKINWYKADTYDYLYDCIKNIQHIREFNNLNKYFNDLKDKVLGIDELKDFILAIDQNDISKIKKAYEYIDQIKLGKKYMDNINIIINKLKKSCPETMKIILSSEKYGDFKFFKKAWMWAKYNSFLNYINNLKEDELIQSLKRVRDEKLILTNELVSKKAWYNKLTNITEKEKRSLFSWMQAIKNISKEDCNLEYIKIAKQELEQCKFIVPIWIMPTEKVIENIDISKNMFDVIICDEGNKSNLFSICALMRAKKAIIIGNEKDQNAMNSNIKSEIIKDLMEKYLIDIPHKQWFDMKTSLYDTALRVFPTRAKLKYNFCVYYKKHKNLLDNLECITQSNLSKDFFKSINQKGFNVKRGFNIDKNKLDFIIQNKNKKLAIICDDGSLYDEIKIEDMLRIQMDLSRLGWNLYILRGSKFYKNPDLEVTKITNMLTSSDKDKSDRKENLRVV